MRRHGKRARDIAASVDRYVVTAMWSARVHREARRGAIAVEGPGGLAVRIEAVGLDGYGVVATEVPISNAAVRDIARELSTYKQRHADWKAGKRPAWREDDRE